MKGYDHLEDPDKDGMDRKVIRRLDKRWLGSSTHRQGPVAGSYEHGNWHFGFTNLREFLH
jgi:hypothetical protein